MNRLDEIRAQALSRADAVERQYRFAFFGGVALEGVLLMLFLFVADLSNRTHVLILLGSVMSYSLVILGLVALGAHVSRTALRILQAIDGRDSSEPTGLE